MKSIIENTNESVPQKNEFEEIADIPEAVADGINIDGEENFEEESVVELDLKEYEELGVPDIRSLKSMTILDELDTDSHGKNSLIIEKESVNIEKLTIKIDGLTSVQKRNKKIEKHKKITKSLPEKEEEIQARIIKEEEKEQNKKEIAQIVEELKKELKQEIRQEVKEEVKDEVRAEVKEEVKYGIKQEVKQEVKEKVKQEISPEQTDFGEDTIAKPVEDISTRAQTRIIENAIDRDRKEIAKIFEELKQEIRQIKINSIDEKIEEKIERTLERREKETKQSKKENHISEIKTPQQVKTNITEKIETESVKEVFDRAIETITKPNTLTIEIPEQLLEELPANLKIDELGKINLKEAESIAEEDLLSWAKDDILEELENIDFLAEKPGKTAESKQKEKPKIITTKTSMQETPEQKNVKKEKEDIVFKTAEKPAEKEIKDSTETKEKNGKELKEKKVEISKKDAINKEPKKTTAAEKPEKGTDENHQLPVEEILIEKETTNTKTDVLPEEKEAVKASPDIKTEKKTTSADNKGVEISNENVFIIENATDKTKDTEKIFSEFDELGNIASSIVDVIEGKAKQLHESDVADKKAVTGLIRDNYPTFKDLLKEKEVSAKQIYSDDDINFVDNSFISKEQKTFVNFKAQPEEVERIKTAQPFEQMLGLAAEEFDLIEDQIFKIKDREINLDKTTSAAPGLDQHPDDTLALDKYKYILPTPDSLLDYEKKSIEDDISSPSALIYEEDVDKIKKKLEASMKQKIEETIQDITDKITIYEDNKTRNNSQESAIKDKDEIKRLLKYLNDLLEKLPEEAIETFANSEYYDLYKKVLKEMDI